MTPEHTAGCVNCPGTFVHTCQTPKFKVTIASSVREAPFWTKYTSTKEHAERIFVKNQRLIDREQWKHVIKLSEVKVSCEWARMIVGHGAVAALVSRNK